MPYVLAGLGILFLIVAIRGTQSQAFALLTSEFTGKGSFVPWMAAIVILGAIGYVRPLRPVTDSMILLIFLVIVLADKGNVFKTFNAAIKGGLGSANAAGSVPATGQGATGQGATGQGAPTGAPAPAFSYPGAPGNTTVGGGGPPVYIDVNGYGG